MAVLITSDSGEWLLPAGETILGRGIEAHLRIDDPRLSRAHARLRVAGPDEATIEDLGTTNGVLIRGQRITAITALTDGDALWCGGVGLRVIIDRSAHPDRLVHRRGPSSGLNPKPRAALAPEIARHLHERERAAAAPVPTPDEVTVSGLHPSPSSPATSGALTGRILRKAVEPTEAVRILPEAPAPMPHSVHTSSILAPEELRPVTDSALAVRSGYWARRDDFPRRRLLAGALELATVAGVAWIGGGLAFLIGIGAAAHVAEARVHAGAITVGGVAGDMATVANVVVAVLGGAWRDLGTLLPQLWAVEDARAWLVAGSLALILLWTLTHLGVIGATARHGAPTWHRRFGIAIMRHPNGGLCSWPRAALRWIALGATLPVAAITALLGRRGWHDRIAGCELADRRTRPS